MIQSNVVPPIKKPEVAKAHAAPKIVIALKIVELVIFNVSPHAVELMTNAFKNVAEVN